MASSGRNLTASRSITKQSFRVIVVRQIPGSRQKGRVRAGHLAFPCALGKGGVVSAKREGDGGTPRGRFALRRLWFRADGRMRPTTGGLPVRVTRQHDGWCDATGHARYNRPVRLPFPASHEKMWREDSLYDLVVEIGWNDRPTVAGRGSAIFLHLARPGFTPTEGCVAVTRSAMVRLIKGIGPHTRIDIA